MQLPEAARVYNAMSFEPNRMEAGALAGIAGAVSVTLLHESTRHATADAPRMDVIGMRGLARIYHALGSEPPDRVREATLGGDLAANSLYYGLVTAVDPDHGIATGAALGAIAGLGAVLLPGPLGLGRGEVNRSRKTEALAAGIYLAGGLVAGWLYQSLANRR